jgi:protein-disulfide isomerase
LAALVIAGGIFGMVKLGAKNPADQTGSLIDLTSSSDWSKGNKEAKIVLVEYSDFQCPACGAYYPLLKQLNQELSGEVQFVYRHFPLRQIHANAELAARAAEAAGRQGKFWEYHDLLFENQREWSEESRARDIFVRYAQSLDLDTGRFTNDMDSQEIKEKVDKDYASGVRSAVDATPTFFLNGKRIQNPRSYEEFRSVIEEAVKNSS